MLPVRTDKDHSDMISAAKLDTFSGSLEKNSDSSLGSGDVTSGEDQVKKSTLNLNTNNNSKRRSDSPASPAASSKSRRLSVEYTSESKNSSNSINSQKKDTVDQIELAKLQRQAMQLAYLQQQQSLLKSAPPQSPEDTSSSRSMPTLAGAIGSSTSNNEMQQLLAQQVIGSQQLQAILQQQAISAQQQQQQQQQAQQVQDIYKQQLQEFQMQLAAAQLQQKSSSSPLSATEEAVNGGIANGLTKLTKDQQQLQQQYSIRQLLQLQQQQALQQHKLAATLALAQGQQNFITPDLQNELQQLILKSFGDNSLPKGVTSPFSISGAGATFQDFINDRGVANNKDSLQNGAGDEDKRSSSHRTTSREGSPMSSQPLFSRGVCKWPGCDSECGDMPSFQRHLNECHRLDDKTTAQYRVQLQVVEQLEKQLTNEKERLDAMSQHLTRTEEKSAKPDPPPSDNELVLSQLKQSTLANRPAVQIPASVGFSGIPFPPNSAAFPRTSNAIPSSPLSNPHLPSFTSSMFQQGPSSPPSSLITSHLPVASRDGILQGKRRTSGSVPISADLSQNQEFYRNADVRPPFTYASLIRQAIIETPDCQMTLNEIYNWFQKKFAYFRRNAPTWKSAIRTNLSLHNCFKRCEDVMGSYWTVDDKEFRKGRHLKRGRPRKYEEKETPPQNPNVRGRPIAEGGGNSNYYGQSMNLAALQMMLSDTPLNSSQLANQAQSTLANKLPAGYSAFLQNNLAAFSQGRTLEGNSDGTSTPPTSITVSKSETFPGFVNTKLKEENERCENFPTVDSPKTEALSDDPAFNKESFDVKNEPLADSCQVEFSQEDELNGEGLELPEADASKNTGGNQNLNFSNGLLKQHVSARGSFAMLHDHTGAE